MSRVSKSSDTGTTYYPSSDYSVSDGTSTVYVSGPSGLTASIEYDGTTATTNTIHTDHLGSTSVVTNEDGTMIELIDYYPYGTERISWSSTSDSGESDTQKTYIGEYFDEETNLSYLNARYYDPQRGQFLSQDPVFVNVGTGDKRGVITLLDPQMMNSYLYGRGNPIELVDSTGEMAFLALAPYASSIVAGLTALVSTPALQTQLFDGAQTLLDQSSSTGAKAWGALGVLSSFTAPGNGAAAEWGLSSFARGRALENIYGTNLAWNFPVIDRFMNGVVTSIKSLDLNAKTYQNMGALGSKLKGYVDDVTGFVGIERWGKDSVKLQDITSRELQVIIPKGSLTDGASKVFQDVTDYAKGLGVDFKSIEH